MTASSFFVWGSALPSGHSLRSWPVPCVPFPWVCPDPAAPFNWQDVNFQAGALRKPDSFCFSDLGRHIPCQGPVTPRPPWEVEAWDTQVEENQTNKNWGPYLTATTDLRDMGISRLGSGSSSCSWPGCCHIELPPGLRLLNCEQINKTVVVQVVVQRLFKWLLHFGLVCYATVDAQDVIKA